MSSKTNSGISYAGVIFIVFLILKLTNNINWSWLWVTSPLWLPLAIVVGFVLIVLLFIVILLLFGVSFEKITNKIDVFKKTLKD